MSELERLSKLLMVAPSGCWVWIGHRSHDGYGRFTRKRADGSRCPVNAHRVTYELLVGPIPDGYHVDHLCRNRACVNPRHLQAVTAYENWWRGTNVARSNAERTTCRRSHPLSGPNLQVITRPDGRTTRRCKACARDGRRRRALSSAA